MLTFLSLFLNIGVNKFSKRLLNPNYIPNNELLDFISRLPSDEELVSLHQIILSSAITFIYSIVDIQRTETSFGVQKEEANKRTHHKNIST